MRITPHYDHALLTIDGGPPIIEVIVGQRRRLLDVFGSLADEQWAAPSRCEGWRVLDVAAHLVSTDPLWLASITAGLAGEPTRFLRDGFDPKATPAALVDAAAASSSPETLDALRASTARLCELLRGLDESALSTMAESPLGHVSIGNVLHHMLWDTWVHERDVTLPLGLVPAIEPDEVAAALRNVAALNAAFAVMSGTARVTTLVVDARSPDVRFLVSVTEEGVRVHDGEPPADAVALRGNAVELTDMFSARSPVDRSVPDDRAWLVRSLADVFEA